MLIARGMTHVGTVQFRSALAFSRRAWLGIVARSGLWLDTRFVPPTPARRRAGVCLYILRRGWFEVHDAPALRFEGPAAFVLSEEHMEGANGVRPLTYAAGGSPSEQIEVHLAERDLGTRVASPLRRPTAVVLDDAAWDAAARVVDRMEHGEDVEIERAVESLLAEVARVGVVRPEVAEAARAGLPFETLWRAIAPLARRFALSATVDELSSLSDASPRQLSRYLEAFFGQFQIFGGKWRTVMRILRLKLAVLFLSAEHTTIAEVARIVGYGSTDAMARALRDAGAASPTDIRAALRAVPRG